MERPAQERPELPRGPVRGSERAVAPDLARGFMLLLIVLSNSMFFLWAAERAGPGVQHPTAQHAADGVAQFVMVLVLDVRVFPLFAFLFGYGMMQLFLRQTGAGTPESRAVRVLRRRSLWLLVFGFLHAALLLATDVLFAYGVISLVLGGLFLHRSGRTMLGWSAGATVLLALMFVLGCVLTYAAATGAVSDPPDAASGSSETDAAGESNYLAAAVLRLATWLGISSLTVFGLTAPVAMLLGLWAARRRVLEEPHRHLPLLRRTALIGITVGMLGSLPAALAQIGVLELDAESAGRLGLLAMQWPTGLAGGIGYVALFGLIAHRVSGRAGPGLAAVTAVGKRSLSCYLSHSVLLAPVLAAWGLGVGAHLGSATMALYAIGAWLVTLAGAYALERAGRRGPAEVVLRRLIYPGSSRTAEHNRQTGAVRR